MPLKTDEIDLDEKPVPKGFAKEYPVRFTIAFSDRMTEMEARETMERYAAVFAPRVALHIVIKKHGEGDKVWMEHGQEPRRMP